LSSPEHVEFADLLLERASGDLDALWLLAPDEDQADQVVGAPLDRQEIMALTATSLRWARSFVEAAR